MSPLSLRVGVTALILAPAAGLLGGCAANADLSYGSYQWGPGAGVEVYERRVHGGTGGFGGEACEGVVGRGAGPYGEAEVTGDVICRDGGY